MYKVLIVLFLLVSFPTWSQNPETKKYTKEMLIEDATSAAIDFENKVNAYENLSNREKKKFRYPTFPMARKAGNNVWLVYEAEGISGNSSIAMSKAKDLCRQNLVLQFVNKFLKQNYQEGFNNEVKMSFKQPFVQEYRNENYEHCYYQSSAKEFKTETGKTAYKYTHCCETQVAGVGTINNDGVIAEIIYNR
jgi:hypothetical protein